MHASLSSVMLATLYRHSKTALLIIYAYRPYYLTFQAEEKEENEHRLYAKSRSKILIARIFCNAMQNSVF
jgi:hypothetical protein